MNAMEYRFFKFQTLLRALSVISTDIRNFLTFPFSDICFITDTICYEFMLNVEFSVILDFFLFQTLEIILLTLE